MKISERRIREIIREEINALDFFNGINSGHGLTPWGVEGREERFQPSNASCAKNMPSSGDFKLHSYNDWVKNYKPKGISYQEYVKMEL